MLEVGNFFEEHGDAEGRTNFGLCETHSSQPAPPRFSSDARLLYRRPGVSNFYRWPGIIQKQT